MNGPKVSILMGIKDCAATLPESIVSILQQTLTDWELIICDDASSDDSYRIVLRYTDDARIHVLRNETNLSLAPTLNRCLAAARGDYIARQDGDDLSVPERLARLAAFLDVHPQYALVSSAMAVFDECGTNGVRTVKIPCPKPSDLRFGAVFCHAPMMMRAEAFRALGGYNESPQCRGVEDYELWFRFFAAGYRGYNLPDPLYRAREDRHTYRRKSFRRRLNEARVFWHGCRRLRLPPCMRLYALRPIMAGLIPHALLQMYHHARLRRA